MKSEKSHGMSQISFII